MSASRLSATLFVVVFLSSAGVTFAGAQSDSPPGFTTSSILSLAQSPTDSLPPAGPVAREAEEARAARDREAALQTYRDETLSARAAIAMSMVFPGWGQLYADVPFWSAVGFSVQMFYLANILMERRRVERQRVLRDAAPLDSAERNARDIWVQEHKERARDFLWWSAGGFLILSLDAYVSVQLVDFDSDDPPTPDLDRDWGTGDEPGDTIALRVDFSF